MCAEGGGLQLLSIANSASPELLESLAVAGSCASVHLDSAQDLAAVSARDGGLVMFSTASPSTAYLPVVIRQ